MQAGFKADQVQVSGRFSDYARISDESDRKEHVFHFCPDCGSQVFYTEPTEPDLVVVSVGSFADPSFPPPTESVYDSWRHPWVGLPDSIQRPGPDVWDSVRPLYDAGRYAEAADDLHLISLEPRLNPEGASGPTLAGTAVADRDRERITLDFETKLPAVTGCIPGGHRGET